MYDLIQTALLIILIALGAYIVGRLRRIRHQLREVLTTIANIRPPQAPSAPLASPLEPAFEGRQIEALFAVYRYIDGRPPLPQTGNWAAEADFIRLLLAHISKHRPAIILECGSGTTTVAMAHLVQSYGGRIIALENHSAIAARLRSDLKSRGLDQTVEIINCELSPRSYQGFPNSFQWYDIKPADLPTPIDMLVVDGPWGELNPHARYPAGPELFPLLSRRAHIFLDDTLRDDEALLPQLWLDLEPDLGVRKLRASKGAMELFFLDAKMNDYRSDPEVNAAAKSHRELA